MLLPAAAALPVPGGWTDEQALGLVVSWPTALAALRPLGGVSAGQTVLIHAAAGGTGQAAVQTFGQVMSELFELLATGVVGAGRPTAHPLADGPKALTALEGRETVGKLALLP